MQRTDSQIKQAVLDELKWDTRVEDAEVGVTVRNAIVSLTGSVSHWACKLAAQEAAHRVAGVLDVANDIKVRIPGAAERTDSDIAQAIRRALEWDVFVPEARIRSTVSAGWVTLEGDVDFWTQRDDAEKTVKSLDGVRGVENQIEVKAPRVAAVEVRRAIGEALRRRAPYETPQIEVQDGRVHLAGVVQTSAERAAVLAAARATPGVVSVVDQLRVEPHSN